MMVNGEITKNQGVGYGKVKTVFPMWGNGKTTQLKGLEC